MTNDVHSNTCLSGFSDSYEEARDRFLVAVKSVSDTATNCHLDNFKLDGICGVNGEDLFCDVATIGAKDSERCIIVSSGCHGIEGYCGSLLQEHLLNTAVSAEILRGIQIVFIHAINPYGFSYGRRTNEQNIDVNRNFIDFDSFNNSEEMYSKFREAVFPHDWQQCSLSITNEKVEAYVQEQGADKFQAMMTKGQYSYPNDPYFGGHSSSWSRKTWEAICVEVTDRASLIVHIDIHTGLGEPGVAELIYAGKMSEELVHRANSFFGGEGVKIPGSGTSVSPPISGILATGLTDLDETAISVALEFGTVPIGTMLNALIADNWLYNNPDCHDSLQMSIRAEMKNAFFVETERWQQRVRLVMVDVFGKAIVGLRSLS